MHLEELMSLHIQPARAAVARQSSCDILVRQRSQRLQRFLPRSTRPRHTATKIGKAQSVMETSTKGLELRSGADVNKFLEGVDDGVSYPAPATTRQDAGVVHSAAARVLRVSDNPEDVLYEPELQHTKWQFPPNAGGAKTAAKPTVSYSASYDEWAASIKAELQQHSGAGVPRLLIFVHGYNTLPFQANETGHRLLQPMGPEGGLGVQAVVSFTWDSAGQWFSYPGEEHMAESDILSGHLADLIRRLLHIKLDHGKRWQLVILAHSMGNRPTTLALGKVYNDEKAALQLNTADAPMLVINAAADIDASTYSQKMAPVMAIVLASSYDIPLIGSYTYHDKVNEKDGKEQRVGLLDGVDAGPLGLRTAPFTAIARIRNSLSWNEGDPVVEVPNLDIIDCSNASEKERMNRKERGNGHSYYVKIEEVRAEIAAAMVTPNTAQRLLKYKKHGIDRLHKAPADNPEPFVNSDGPLYKIKELL